MLCCCGPNTWNTLAAPGLEAVPSMLRGPGSVRDQPGIACIQGMYFIYELSLWVLLINFFSCFFSQSLTLVNLSLLCELGNSKDSISPMALFMDPGSKQICNKFR